MILMSDVISQQCDRAPFNSYSGGQTKQTNGSLMTAAGELQVVSNSQHEFRYCTADLFISITARAYQLHVISVINWRLVVSNNNFYRRDEKIRNTTTTSLWTECIKQNYLCQSNVNKNHNLKNYLPTNKITTAEMAKINLVSFVQNPPLLLNILNRQKWMQEHFP